jgi:hypothetical protein
MALQDTIFEELIRLIGDKKGCYYHPDIPLRPCDVQYYNHPDGWIVKEAPGIEHKLWIYVHCRKCGYDTAIWKLGVPRDHIFGLPETWEPTAPRPTSKREKKGVSG